MVRVLPENVARPLEALRHVAARRTDPDPPHPETTATLVRASADQRRVRIGYALGPHRERTLQVDPWAVVVRHGRWYVLGWSHAADARRLYRIDRVRSVEVLDEPFTPPDRPRAAPRPGGAAVAGLAVPGRGGDRRPARGRAALAAAQPRPHRGDRRRADPADRQHREPRLVRHRDRRDPATFRVVGGEEIRDAVRRLASGWPTRLPSGLSSSRLRTQGGFETGR